MKLLMALCALALVYSTGATGASTPLAAPSGLHAFVYRADEPVKADHTYTQMPAFAWAPVRGANRYELQLSTNKAFNDAEMLVDRKNIQVPITSIDLQVPWMTGHPFALWVRVRAYSTITVSRWSSAFGFNTAWQQLPIPEPSPNGLIRWRPVDGATGYEVWFPDIQVRFRTLTNVADEREFWMSHPDLVGNVNWRVRAMRFVHPPSLPDDIQVVTYGPYTTMYTKHNVVTPAAAGDPRGTDAISNVDSASTRPTADALMPGFAWKPTNGLFRVYVYSDRGCVNSVTIGSIVAGPAWAPRSTMILPEDPAAPFGPGPGLMFDDTPIATSEDAFASGPPDPKAPIDTGYLTDPWPGITLPDNGSPSGRYWWTVVPVLGNGQQYKDQNLPQFACERGVWQFGMQSTSVLTQDKAPFVSGLRGSRVVSSSTPVPSFAQLPLITWKTALGAQGYEIQLSRHLYPWITRIKVESSVPSATLPLTKVDVGTWYYRIRGLNANLPGTANKMTWSKTAAIRISGDRYVVVK